MTCCSLILFRGELIVFTKIPDTGRVTTLNQQFGDIDIYLFDQLLRRRIVPGMRVLDAGCSGAGT